MSDKIQRQLLSALIDKYERSSFFREGTQPTRRIMLKLYDNGQCDFPQYGTEQSEKRILVNCTVLTISKKGLVSYQWMKGEENHIIAKVWLNFENLPTAYEFAGRKSKSDMIDDVCLEILGVLDNYIYKRKTDNELVIYHGGQYSPSKKKFLQVVAKTISGDCRWLHWGDIDYGGFSMLARLRREIKEDVIPYRMNEQELNKYDDLTVQITDLYSEKLKSLMKRPELKDCLECLNYMVRHEKKLEQEAMMTDAEL